MIFDAIMFNNEIDLLEIRLHELAPVVDRFIVVESLEYHGSSKPKPANFLCNLDVFRPFTEKIEYVLLERLDPPHRGPHDSWPRENYHRNAIMGGLERFGTSERDLVMISDCDEIPRASAVHAYVTRSSHEVYSFEQDLFYYSVNNFMGLWHGTTIGPLKALYEAGGPQGFRNRRDSWPTIKSGGWHFSYFGGWDRIVSKVGNFAHACEDSAKLARHWLESGDTTPADLFAGKDIYRRSGCDRKERRSHDDPRLPAYMREHLLGKYRLATEEGLRERLNG